MRKNKGKYIREELSREERELFLNAFYQGNDTKKHDEKPSSSRPSSEKKSVEKKTVTHCEITDHDREIFLQAVNDGDYFTKKTAISTSSSVSAPRIARSKKRRIVDATLDLHGFIVEDALLALHRFIELEKKRGSKTLLIIHGIGTGALKRAVWIAIDGHQSVEDFQGASGKLGGEGAILVRLRRHGR